MIAFLVAVRRIPPFSKMAGDQAATTAGEEHGPSNTPSEQLTINWREHGPSNTPPEQLTMARNTARRTRHPSNSQSIGGNTARRTRHPNNSLWRETRLVEHAIRTTHYGEKHGSSNTPSEQLTMARNTARRTRHPNNSLWRGTRPVKHAIRTTRNQLAGTQQTLKGSFSSNYNFFLTNENKSERHLF